MSLAPHVLVRTSLAAAAPGDTVAVDAGTLHHLRRVLRLADGATLQVTDGAGRQAPAVLAVDGATLTGPVVAAPTAAPRIVLAQALAKGRRTEDAVRVACELGVDRIVPVVAERTQGRPDASAAAALVERWEAVAVAALEQSRGTRLPEVTAPVAGLHAVASAAAAPGVRRLVAVPGAPALPDVLSPTATGERLEEVVLAIGPEGGWSDAEVDAALADGWSPAGLGPTVLRTEHAGPVAVAVAAALVGRWRGDTPA